MKDFITKSVAIGLLTVSAAMSADAQSYRAPADGKVTFSITEIWYVQKGSPRSDLTPVDALLIVTYPDGEAQGISFVYSELQLADEMNGAPVGKKVSVWTQTASLKAGSTFEISSTLPAEQYNPTQPFEGGQEGAYVAGQ